MNKKLFHKVDAPLAGEHLEWQLRDLNIRPKIQFRSFYSCPLNEVLEGQALAEIYSVHPRLHTYRHFMFGSAIPLRPHRDIVGLKTAALIIALHHSFTINWWPSLEDADNSEVKKDGEGTTGHIDVGGREPEVQLVLNAGDCYLIDTYCPHSAQTTYEKIAVASIIPRPQMSFEKMIEGKTRKSGHGEIG